ncbi:hypothetical protein GQ457_16G017350 [Hibiscus cannabinus]
MENRSNGSVIDYEDADTLELEEDGSINAAIKEHALVGKVLSNRGVQRLKVWNCDGNLECHDLEKNMLLFVFEFPHEKDRVMKQGPWSINNKLLILKEWPKEATLEEIDFSLAEFWVQIHNVPMALINGNNAEKIGKLFPKFIKSNIDAEQSVRWDGQLRIFVAFRIKDPLKTGFILKRSSFNPIEVSFKYERLPEFCFSCGRLGHAEKECWYDYNRYTRAGKYGLWLRATSTWIKHNHNKNGNLSPQKCRSLLVDFHSKEGEGQGKEINYNATVPDEGNSTRVEEASATVKGKDLLDYPMVKSKAIIVDSEILGETKNPGLPEIMEAHCEKGEMTDQITNAAIEIHGSGTIWNNPGKLPDQTLDKLNKGKSKVNKEGFNGEKDKLIEDVMADSLKDMDLSVSRKRKCETSSFSARKKQSLLKEINDGIFEISPGNWGDDGFGPVACESFLKLAFFPESVSGSSLIINKIENRKRGLSFGMRRLSLIKKDARRKHVYEIARMTVENNLVIEKGIDPYGYNVNCIPSFTVADDPSRIDDPMALAFEDVDTFYIVDDSLGSHPNPP